MIILNYFHCLLSTAKLFFWLILISSLAGKRLAALLAKFAVLLRRHAVTAIAEYGYIVEINTKSYHDLGTFYPNKRYFSFLKELGIRVQVNSDAHYPERINNGRAEALAALKKAGFTSVVEWHGGKWEDKEIL